MACTAPWILKAEVFAGSTTGAVLEFTLPWHGDQHCLKGPKYLNNPEYWAPRVFMYQNCNQALGSLGASTLRAGLPKEASIGSRKHGLG